MSVFVSPPPRGRRKSALSNIPPRKQSILVRCLYGRDIFCPHLHLCNLLGNLPWYPMTPQNITFHIYNLFWEKVITKLTKGPWELTSCSGESNKHYITIDTQPQLKNENKNKNKKIKHPLKIYKKLNEPIWGKMRDRQMDRRTGWT